MRVPSDPTTVPPIRPPYQVIPSRAKKQLRRTYGLSRSDTSIAK